MLSWDILLFQATFKHNSISRHKAFGFWVESLAFMF